MLYDKNGYLNWEHIINKKLPFNIIIGGRGTGKTYGILKYVIEHEKKFMLLRRTQSQIDMLSNESYNPFKSLNFDMGWVDPYYGIEKEGKNLSAVYQLTTDEKGKTIRISNTLGYGAALSTIKNIRGFDGSDIEYLLFDEFIPEAHEREMRFEGSAFFNAYETINRNRELQGKEPLKAVLLANANNISSAILIELGIVKIICKLMQTGRDEYIDRNRGIGVWYLQDSPISVKKADTALYRIAPESYSKMAIKNEFGSDYTENIVSRNLQEYKPLCKIGELVIYRHKSLDKFYVTTHLSGSPLEFPYTDDGMRQFRHKFSFLHAYALFDKFEYENELCRILLTKIGI